MDKPVEPSTLISELVAESLAKAKGDLAKAAAYMSRRVENDEQLFRALMMPMVEQACYDHLRSHFRARREAIWTAPNYTKAGNGDRLTALADSLLNFTLPHKHIFLRDACKEDLFDGARFYESSANNMLGKARWLRAIAVQLGKALVGNKFNDAQLRALQEQTE